MAFLDSPAARAYVDAPLPSANTPWREAAYSVIDLETTGLDPSSDEIIAFAAVTVAGGTVRLDDARYELVRPDRMPDPDTIRIHGLRETDLSDAPPLSDLLDGLLEALTGRVVVAHVAAVERGFIGAALSSNGLKLRNPIVDTAALDRELRRLRRQPPADTDPVGLSDLARSLGLPVHRPHHADGDALTTAQAFIALATHLESFEPQTLGSLERMADTPRRMRKWWPIRTRSS
jgi:DNA polymerase III subunit epsilon